MLYLQNPGVVIIWWVGRDLSRWLFLGKHSESSIEAGEVGTKDVDKKEEQLAEIKQAEKVITAVFLEGGIVFHSIFVGINFGVLEDDGTTTALLIALIFHQVGMLLTDLAGRIYMYIRFVRDSLHAHIAICCHLCHYCFLVLPSRSVAPWCSDLATDLAGQYLP